MSDQQTSSTGLREVLIETVREAVRAELKAFGAHAHIEDRLLDAQAAAKLLSVSIEWSITTPMTCPLLVSSGARCCDSRISGFKNIFRAE